MYQNINKIYHAAIYVRLSKEDGDISSSAKLESNCLLYTSDAADEEDSVDLGGRRIIKKKKIIRKKKKQKIKKKKK